MKHIATWLLVNLGLASALVTAQTPESASQAYPLVPTKGATDFVATTSNQVVEVVQKGTGVAIVGFAPSSDGVLGQTQSTTGGVGVHGVATSTAAGVGTGIRGESATVNGLGAVGVASGASGIGVWGETTAANGLAGYFDNTAGGNILLGAVNSVPKFRVDGTGKGFFDGGTQTGGADFAEAMAIAGMKNRYEPGDLMTIDPSADRRLTLTTQPYSTLVAGIYSTKPGVLATAHKMDEGLDTEVPLAVVGIVPCKVSAENGSIERGDLLVTSATPGHAMKGTDRSRMLGAVVGKALEPLSSGKGVVQVLVTLQ